MFYVVAWQNWRDDFVWIRLCDNPQMLVSKLPLGRYLTPFLKACTFLSVKYISSMGKSLFKANTRRGDLWCIVRFLPHVCIVNKMKRTSKCDTMMQMELKIQASPNATFLGLQMALVSTFPLMFDVHHKVGDAPNFRDVAQHTPCVNGIEGTHELTSSWEQAPLWGNVSFFR